MRHPITVSLALAGLIAVSGCDRSGETEVNRALADVNAIDDNGLSDIMLTIADPAEGVRYFTDALAADPTRIDHARGLAKSLIRAGRPADAITAWRTVIALPDANWDDSVELADAQIRTGDWDGAEVTLDTIPPTYETFKRYRLEAMVADSNEEWENADSFYEIAVGLTTTPAGTLNNWGFSKLTRGDASGAEALFIEALQNNPDMFTAKNNLVLARSAQRNYDLPVVRMTQIERAQLLHTAALAAIKNGDVAIGRGLLREAIGHPSAAL